STMVLGSGLVYLDHQQAPFTPSLFHQLQCLDIWINPTWRRTMYSYAHCLNYLRQMILCRGDTLLEMVQDPVSSRVDKFGVYQCRDWAVVYDTAAHNQ
ncbi:hypothetical protein C8Q72DRAFT_790721, partial [Fomitopsis betulina]